MFLVIFLNHNNLKRKIVYPLFFEIKKKLENKQSICPLCFIKSEHIPKI
jgi:hypothetical protein